jgi:hypothetical protein
MLNRFLNSCGHIILIYIIAFFFCNLLCGWLKLPGGEYGMMPLLLLLLGGVVLGMYLLYAAIHYLISRSIVPTNKLIIIVFFVSVAIVFLANVSTPLDVIILVFIASLFLVSIMAWLSQKLMFRLVE